MKREFRGYLFTKLWAAGKVLAVMLLIFYFNNFQKINSRELRSVSSLKRSLSAVSDEWPTMTALLVYDGGDKEHSVKKILKTFKRASRHRRYKGYVDFVSANLSDLDQSEKNTLQKMTDRNPQNLGPEIYLFYNDSLVDGSEDLNLRKEREVENFVYDHFEGDILKIKRSVEANTKRVVYYEDRPRVSFGVGFGAPFSAHYYGSPHYYYGYPQGRGWWFGW